MGEPITLRGARLSREFTQEQMADLCGVHVNTYIAWEKEPSKIPVSKAIKICSELKMPIDGIIFCD